MKNVLRMRIGEEVTVSDGQGKEYLCQVRDFEEEQVQLKIVETKASDAELPSEDLSVSGSPEAGEDGIDRAEMCGAWDLCGSPGLHEAMCGEAGMRKKGRRKWSVGIQLQPAQPNSPGGGSCRK